LKPFGRVGLAVTRFSSAGDGVAHVGRLLRHALEPLADDLICLELGAYDGHPISLPRQGVYITQLARAQQAHQPDWWLFGHCDLARLHFGLPQRLRRPFGVFLHGLELRGGGMNRARRRVLEQAEVRLANSRHTARQVVTTCPEAGVVSICPLALLPAAAGDGVAPELLRSVGEDYALIVARMNADERFKGHDALLDAWGAVRGAVPGARLVVVGGGDDVARLQAKAASLGLGGAVRFTGHVSDATLAALRARAAFFVMPSTNEGFGLVYLEAMRAGLACIGGAGDAAAEIIVDGQTGLLVAPDSTPALAAAVTRLFLEPDFARRLGAAGRARAEREYTLSRFQARVASALHLPFAYLRASSAAVPSTSRPRVTGAARPSR
jgi:phosphatidyl-myo-inositol dimannoside synthase